MKQRIALFWPGDGRDLPNELALPSVAEATRQMDAALRKLGKEPYLVDGFLTKPHHAIERLGPVHDPMVGICVHWFYGPHTTEGVVGKTNPLLLASNFSGQWPGLVGLLNTGACLESLGRPFSRVWTDVPDWTKDEVFMARLEEWCRTGRIAYPEDDIAYSAPVSQAAAALAGEVARQFHERRALILMLGDTSMGMINGYFGPRLLNRHSLHRAQGRPGVDHPPRAEHLPLAARRGHGLRQAARRDVPLGGAGRRGLHRERHARAAARLPGGARPGERVQGRLPGLAVPARPAAAPPAVGLRRGALQLGVPARVERRPRRSAPPRPTRATPCRWR